ncbi:MAG: thioredoxin family protein [bacterium]
MFISEKDKIEIQNQLGNLQNDVELILFSQKIGCQYCQETEQLLKELIEIVPRLKLTIYNPVLDEEYSKKYDIGKDLPVILVKSANNPNSENVKFVGIPVGYEFTWLLSYISAVANNKYHFDSSTIDLIKSVESLLEKNSFTLHMKVLETPNCPYCSIMAINCSAFASLCKNIRLSIIDVAEFPEYAQKYSVIGVPKTVITLIGPNVFSEGYIEGALYEKKLVEKVIDFISRSSK